MIKKLNHIGIAVKDLEAQVAFYRDKLHLEFIGYEDLPDRFLKVAVFDAGNVHLELLSPTREDTPVGKFLVNRGEGLHHVSYEVDDIDATIKELQTSGIQMIDDVPRPGASNALVAFMHPKSTFYVLTEICQTRSS